MKRSRRSWVWWLIGVIAAVAALSLLAIPPNRASGVTDRNASPVAPLVGASASRPLRILVIGGTSGIGRETVKLALERGHIVTAMARRAPTQAESSDRWRFVTGDIADGAAIRAAVAGQDAVVTTISAGATRNPVSVFSVGARNVLAAMQAEGVVRLVAVTGIGAGDSRGHGGFGYDRLVQPLLLRSVYEDKDREEALIRASAVDWTIVRPGFLTDKAAAAGYEVVTDMSGVRSGAIARADVAHFIVATLESGSWSRQAVLLTN